MDIQLVLIIVLVILTINLVAVGCYIFLILKDLRKTIQKTNEVLDDVQIVTHTVSNPLTSITTLVNYIVKGFKSTRSVSSLVDFDNKKEE